MSDEGLEELAGHFKIALRRLTTTVSLVTTASGERRFGMVATAIQSVSADPATLLVCINKDASICEPLKSRGRFAINLLHISHGDLVAIFSGKLKDEARFDHGDWATHEAMPVLTDAQASLVCDVIQVHTVNTHEVIFGRVIAVSHRDDIAPLLYEDGRLAQSAPIMKNSA